METIQINQLLQELNTHILNRPTPLTLEERENLRQETESRLLKILNLEINPVRVYNFFSDLLSDYLFNPETEGISRSNSILQPINANDPQEIKILKERINEELNKFMEIADSSDVTRSSAINLRDSTIFKIMEINNISESSFKLFTDAETNMWRILNISNFVYQPSYSFVIKESDTSDIKKAKENINLTLFILEKGLEDYENDSLNYLNTICLIYIYDKLLQKFANFISESTDGPFLDIFLKQIIWKNSLPEDFNNLHNSVKNLDQSIIDELNFTDENLKFLNELGLDFFDLPVRPIRIRSQTNESVITEPPKFEEDIISDSDFDIDITSISSNDSEPFKKELCKESFITLENYTEKEYAQLLSFYLTKDDFQSYYKLPSCLTKGELLETVISDLEKYIRDPSDPENIPQNIMCISTPPENPKLSIHYITGFTSKPTSKIFIKIAYQFNDSMSFYVTLGSFLKAITLPAQEWFAIPLFGGKRRRLSNLGGFYGESMNHGQIPGFILYKLFTRKEIETSKNLTASEDLSDYPLIFYQDLSMSQTISFETQKNELSLIKMVYYTINFFLKSNVIL